MVAKMAACWTPTAAEAVPAVACSPIIIDCGAGFQFVDTDVTHEKLFEPLVERRSRFDLMLVHRHALDAG
jgi:hypothetical protein